MDMKAFFTKIKGILPTKRKLIQLYSALLFNANIKGFFNGKIYKGPLKNVCTPGLNCYSCPGASGACPLGSLQNSLSSTEKGSWYYVVGILLLWGILFGRMICGWFCPFGWIQELLYKIKTPKLKKNRFTRILSYFKYVLLVFFVGVVPLAYALRDFPLPAFCKYICPAGTLEGAIGLLSNKVNAGELARLGPLFTWKFMLMVSILVGCIFIFRLFCRFLCPLGALYGFFNRISILGIRLERPKCIDCGKCIHVCKMDIHHVADHECISCGECVSVCPTKAISFKGSKILLPENDIVTPTASNNDFSENLEQSTSNFTKNVNKKRQIVRIVSAILAASLLIGTLVYYNFIDKPVEAIPYEGPNFTVPLFDENGVTGEVFDPRNNDGKLIVINFWGTWCGPCKEELPDFARIATDYKDRVTVIAVHTTYKSDTASAYVAENFPNADLLFGFDAPHEDDESVDHLYTLLGGESSAYPMTFILSASGDLLHTVADTLHYADLAALLDAALAGEES